MRPDKRGDHLESCYPLHTPLQPEMTVSPDSGNLGGFENGGTDFGVVWSGRFFSLDSRGVLSLIVDLV